MKTINFIVFNILITACFLTLAISEGKNSFYFLLIISSLNLGRVLFCSKLFTVRVFTVVLIFTMLIPAYLVHYSGYTYNPDAILAAGLFLAGYTTVFQISVALMLPARVTDSNLVDKDLKINFLSLLFFTMCIALSFLYASEAMDLRSAGPLTGSSGAMNIAFSLMEYMFVPVFAAGIYYLKDPSRLRFLIFIFCFLLLGYLSFTTGSRLAVIYILFVAYLILSFGATFKQHLIYLVVGFPLIVLIFPFMLIYRQADFDIFATYSLFRGLDLRFFEILEQIVLDRLNNFRSLILVVQHANDIPYDGSKYLDNIIGLIPRSLWEDKPLIGMNLNMVGRQIGLLYENDFDTSITLSPLGEAFLMINFFGVLVAIGVVAVIWLIERLVKRKDLISRCFYIIMALHFAKLGSYIYVIPWLIGSGILFFLLTSLDSIKLGPSRDSA